MKQQEFLREAMSQLNMDRASFAERLGCAKRALDKWLLPHESNDFREMGEPIWNLVREIIAHEKLKQEHEKLEKKVAKIT